MASPEFFTVIWVALSSVIWKNSTTPPTTSTSSPTATAGARAGEDEQAIGRFGVAVSAARSLDEEAAAGRKHGGHDTCGLARGSSEG